MDQSSLDPSTNLKTENGTPPEDSDNNNALNKPIIPPMESAKKGALEGKRPSKPAPPPPKKPTPYNPDAEKSSTKPSDSSAPSKVVPAPSRGMRKKNTKKEPSSSKFYVESNSDVNFKQGKQDQTMPSETKKQHLSSEISVKSVDKPVLPAPRKTKRKEEQLKKPVESESSAIHKQPETAPSKPRLKPTIITAKKPKNTVDVSSLDKMKDNASSNTAALFQDNAGSSSVETPVEADPPGRPNCPPSTVDEENKELPQPQRPKAPPNTVHEGQKHPSKEIKNERQKDSKNKDPIQKKSKVKPRRPPMAKESAKNRPSRPAPALSNFERYYYLITSYFSPVKTNMHACSIHFANGTKFFCLRQADFCSLTKRPHLVL